MQYTIREAAKTAGIWDKAPHISEIPAQVLNKFHDAVSLSTL